MTWRAPTLLTFLLFLLFPLAASINITRILGKFPDFSTFSSLLAQTHLVSDINSRNTLTVLAVSNDAVMSVAGRSVEDLRKILAVHVILDYFDVAKIHGLTKGTAMPTTLFQTSGLAVEKNGFLNVTRMANGRIAFGSAEEGSPLNANFIREVTTRPYDISVLQVSGVIVPPQVGGGPPPHTPARPGSQAPAPAPSGDAGSPSKAPASSSSVADAPPSHAPPASDAPEASSPAADDSSAAAVSPANTADGPTADDDALDDKSSAARWGVVGAGVAGAVAFAMVALQ